MFKLAADAPTIIYSSTKDSMILQCILYIVYYDVKQILWGILCKCTNTWGYHSYNFISLVKLGQLNSFFLPLSQQIQLTTLSNVQFANLF